MAFQALHCCTVSSILYKINVNVKNGFQILKRGNQPFCKALPY